MKAETLQKRIEKNLFTKAGKLAVKYEEVMELLRNPCQTIHPIHWRVSGRHVYITGNNYNLENGLKLLGIDYETGNDAPRGGMNGYYVRLTAKGKRQVEEFAAAYAAMNQIKK